MGLTFNKAMVGDLRIFAKKNSHSFVTVYFRGQLLELVRWLLYAGKNGKALPISKDELSAEKRSFVSATLLSSEVWGRRAFKGLSAEAGDVDQERRIFVLAFRRSREASAHVVNEYYPVARSWMIYARFLPDELQSFDKEFVTATGLDFECYFNCQLLFWSELIYKDRKWSHVDLSSVAKHPYMDALSLYLKSQAQTVSELRCALWHDSRDVNEYVPFKFRTIRDKPILLSDDQKCGVVIDPLIFAESMTAGPLFTLLRHGHNYGDFFNRFGKAFERYACAILERMYPTSLLSTRLKTDVEGKTRSGNKLQIDAYLNNITDVIIFEMKCCFLSEERIAEDDTECFLSYLKERYVETKESEMKGVAQLAKLVRYISEGEWLGLKNELSKVVRIFPVLVVNDNYLDVGLLGNFLAKEFAAFFGESVTGSADGFLIKRASVKHLILLTVDDLESLEKSIENLALQQLFESYSQEQPERLMSLHNYIIDSSVYADKIRHNLEMVQLAKKLVGKALKDIFRKS